MKLKRTYPFFWLLFLSSFYACVPQQKVVATKKQLGEQDSLLQHYQAQLITLESNRKSKEILNQIDDTSNSRIRDFIEKTREEIEEWHKENTVLIGTVEVKKEDWNRLKQNLSECLKATKRINGKILLLSDLINHNTVLKLEQDVLFEPGKYDVSPAVVISIDKIFEPVAKEIFAFTQKYPDFPLSLAITAKGYADGTNIAENSALYKELKESLSFSSQEITRENLNKALSSLRAKSVVELFKTYTKDKPNSGSIIFVYKGKGEELPDPAVADYKVDDARRRVVLLYWSVFPDY